MYMFLPSLSQGVCIITCHIHNLHAMHIIYVYHFLIVHKIQFNMLSSTACTSLVCTLIYIHLLGPRSYTLLPLSHGPTNPGQYVHMCTLTQVKKSGLSTNNDCK